MKRNTSEVKLSYTAKNVRQVISCIRRNLTSDLLPKKWIGLNQKNRLFGHCHTASGCFYKIFGHQNCHLYRFKDQSRKLVDEDMFHWWIVDKNDRILDITANQYQHHSKILMKLYKNGEKSGLLGFNYKVRVNTLLNKVTKERKL